MKYILTALMLLTFNVASAQDMGGDVVFELRTYLTNEGKLDDLHARFADHTIPLFKKHGIESIGYWVPNDTPNTLIYIIKHKSMDAAKQSWSDFAADPDWKVVAVQSNKNGQILAKAPGSVYMSATAYSMIK